MAANGKMPVRYVYDMPFATRQRLCMALDGSGEWKRLGTVIHNYLKVSSSCHVSSSVKLKPGSALGGNPARFVTVGIPYRMLSVVDAFLP